MPTKRARLVREALSACRWRGHKMSRRPTVADWTFPLYGHEKIYTAWTYTCKRCGMTVTVDLHPAPNGIDIGGEAVALNCKEEL